MRAAAILGLGCSPKELAPFQTDKKIEWRMGMPASGDEADVVLLFGGDGTIHRHLGQLVRLGLPVLVVPAGSGNDFARALGLRRVRDSLAAWRKFCGGRGSVPAENVRSIDLGVIAPIENAGGRPRHIHLRANPGHATSVVWRGWGWMGRFLSGPTGCRAGCAGMAGTC